jgi:anaerobic selenocysteine-containing dehydrogenase
MPASIHYRACNLCEAICGLEIHVADGRIEAIRGDQADPLSRGHICPKAVALKDIHEDPDRLRHPQLRQPDGTWRRIPWDEALDLAAERIAAVQKAHGRDAVAVYSGNPNVHNYGSLLYGPPLLHSLRTRHKYSATSVDQLPHHLASYWMLGHMLLMPVPDLDHTQYLWIFGGNPAVSNGSMMTAPDVKKRLKAIRARSGKVVVVDPRRTETAEIADEHVAIRPGTDAFLLLAVLHTLFDEGLDAPGRVAAFTDRLEVLRAAVADFAPEQVEQTLGMPATDVRRLAREFAAAPSAVAYGRFGVSTQEFGGLCLWLIYALNLITGNLDRRGGFMLPEPAIDLVTARRGRGSHGRWRSKVRGLPEAFGELPVATLAEDLLDPREPKIHALITVAGNPVLSTPNGRALERGLADLDFVLAIDYYRNETTRHAHLILPPTAALEHDHYDLVFLTLAIRNVSRYSEALFAPEADARHDWQILLELQRRLAPKPRAADRAWRLAAGRGPAFLLDIALRRGARGSGFLPFRRGVNLKRLKASPHGIDHGPLEPCLPGRLATPTGRIDAAPEPLVRDLERLRTRWPELRREADGMVLIGRRQLQSNNSWMHNSERLLRGKQRCTLLIHPDDAAERGLRAGDAAEIRSRVGSIEAPIELSAAMRRGVVSLPHGWGHGRPGTLLQVAATKPGVSANDVTDDQRVDLLCGTAAFSAVPVEIRAIQNTGPSAT